MSPLLEMEGPLVSGGTWVQAKENKLKLAPKGKGTRRHVEQKGPGRTVTSSKAASRGSGDSPGLLRLSRAVHTARCRCHQHSYPPPSRGAASISQQGHQRPGKAHLCDSRRGHSISQAWATWPPLEPEIGANQELEGLTPKGRSKWSPEAGHCCRMLALVATTTHAHRTLTPTLLLH